MDEQLVEVRGKCPFRTYIPSKPNKYGLKIIMAWNSGTKFHWMELPWLDAIPYLGKGCVPPKVATGQYFVLELVKTLKGINRNITKDNWFTSVPLVQLLLNEYKLIFANTVKK